MKGRWSNADLLRIAAAILEFAPDEVGVLRDNARKRGRVLKQKPDTGPLLSLDSW